MSKLFDDLMAGLLDIDPPRWIKEAGGKLPDGKKRIQTMCQGAVVYDITNVSDYYWGGTDQEWFDPVEDFSCVRPPFSHFWMESRRPTSIKSTVDKKPNLDRHPDRVGILGKVYDMSDEMTRNFSREQVGVRYKRYVKEKDAFDKGKWTLDRIPDEIMEASVLMGLTSFANWGRTLLGPLQHTYCWLRENGTMIESLAKIEGVPGHPGPASGETVGYEHYTYPALMALDMIHTRNVRVIDVSLPPKLAKANLRRRGVGSVSWKTITILPYTQRPVGDQKETAQGLGARPYQIMPGHYAHYGIVGPGGWLRGKLFGKISGRFWVPEHAVGDESQGIVLNDYRVESPDKEPPVPIERKKSK